MIQSLKKIITIAALGTSLSVASAFAEKKESDKYLQPQEVPIFKDMTLADYKAAFAAKAEVVLVGKAGPLTLKKGHWWKANNEKDGPQLMLEVSLPRVNNIPDSDIGTIKIKYVLGRDGFNYYDKNHSSEKSDFSSRLNFNTPRIYGDEVTDEQIKDILNRPMTSSRNIRLLPGTREDNIVGIGGKVTLNLPTKVELFSFDIQDIGVEKQTSKGKAVKLSAVDGSKITLAFGGNKKDLLRIVAFKGGKALGKSSWSSSTFMGATTQVTDFNDSPDEILVYVAKNVETVTYPFMLGQRPKKIKK